MKRHHTQRKYGCLNKCLILFRRLGLALPACTLTRTDMRQRQRRAKTFVLIRACVVAGKCNGNVMRSSILAMKDCGAITGTRTKHCRKAPTQNGQKSATALWCQEQQLHQGKKQGALDV